MGTRMVQDSAKMAQWVVIFLHAPFTEVGELGGSLDAALPVSVCHFNPSTALRTR